jgi:DNA integrity scanning protein DisA with diadenylate cyclase activity
MIDAIKIQQELALLKESGVYVIEEKLDQFAKENFSVFQEKLHEASMDKTTIAIWNVMADRNKEKIAIVVMGNTKSLYPILKKAGYKLDGNILEKEIEP